MARNGTLDGNVSFTNASLPPGAGNALTLTVHGTIGPSTSGAIANTATVTPGAGAIDVNTGNDSATDIDTPGTSQIDLAVTKTDGQTTYVPGTAITYTITVTNAGPSTADRLQHHRHGAGGDHGRDGELRGHRHGQLRHERLLVGQRRQLRRC